MSKTFDLEDFAVLTYGKCDHDWVIFFLMAGERKMEPMDLIIGRLPEKYVTKKHYREEVPPIDNSDPWVAYLMQPTQKCSKCNKMQL